MKRAMMGLLLLVAGALGDDLRQGLVNRVVAVVNDDVITMTELEREVALMLQRTPLSVDALDGFRRDILDQLIDQHLVLTVAAAEGISLDAEDELEIEALLQQDILDHNNHEQFTADLRAIGFTENAYRERLAATVLTQKATARLLFEDPFIQPQALHEYYERNRHLYRVDQKLVVRHLLIMRKKWSQDELAARKTKVLVELEQGSSLEELIETYSDGPRNNAGGIWELKEAAEFIVGEQAFALEVGERSEFIETDHGLHLVEVLQRDVERTLPFSEVQAQIEQKVRKDLWSKRFRSWRQNLRGKAFIAVYLD